MKFNVLDEAYMLLWLKIFDEIYMFLWLKCMYKLCDLSWLFEYDEMDIT